MKRPPTSGKSVILLTGPNLDAGSAYYGGGIGGITRNMRILLENFESARFEVRGCFNSVRRVRSPGIGTQIVRLLQDGARFFRASRRTAAVHIFGQYHQAIYREFLIVLLAGVRQLPVLYQIRAGTFITWHENISRLERFLVRNILERAHVVLCEGPPYLDFLSREYGTKAHYFPNFVPAQEIPKVVEPKLEEPVLKVLFVGFCYEKKGVYELVKGCRLAASRDLRILLSLVGEQSVDFQKWLSSTLPENPLSLTLESRGSLSHESVLAAYRTHDIFCLPTRHPGEGHNNTINEAMMMGLVIICTRRGFLESVLGSGAFFLERGTPEEIAAILSLIDSDRPGARSVAGQARKRLLENFTGNQAFPQLEGYYRMLVDPNFKIAGTGQGKRL